MKGNYLTDSQFHVMLYFSGVSEECGDWFSNRFEHRAADTGHRDEQPGDGVDRNLHARLYHRHRVPASSMPPAGN